MKRYLLLERRMTLHHHSPYWECVMAVLDAGQKRQNARHHNPSLAIQQTLRSSVARFFVLYSHPLKLHISRPSLLTKLWIKYLSDAFFYDCQTEMPIKLLTRFIASELNKIAKWMVGRLPKFHQLKSVQHNYIFHLDGCYWNATGIGINISCSLLRPERPNTLSSS